MIIVGESKIRWHLSPTTGRLERCKAKTSNSCRFGGDLIAADSPVDAHRAYETFIAQDRTLEAVGLFTPLKKRRERKLATPAARKENSKVGEFLARHGHYLVGPNSFRHLGPQGASKQKARAALRSSGRLKANPKQMRRSSGSNFIARRLLGRRGLLRKPIVAGALGATIIAASPTLAPVGAIVLASSALVVFAKGKGKLRPTLRSLW